MTLKSARTMREGASNRGMSSVWSHTVRDKRGRLKVISPPHSNLRVQSGSDWQAYAMAGTSGGSANIFATASGFATSVTATSLTNTGASFPTTAVVTGATGGLAGQIVSVGPNNAGAGTTVYGVIVSNTATVLTVDRWVTSINPFAAATTPNGTGAYSIIQGMAPAWYLGLSSTVQSGTATDVVLAGEFTVGGGTGLNRANAVTFTHTLASATYTIARTFTAAGAGGTVNSEAVFVAAGLNGIATAANSGPMVFENAEPTPPALVAGDTLAQTVSVAY